MKLLHLLRWPLLLFIIYFALGLSWEGVRLVVLGYPPPGSPEETALWIMENKKDPSLCLKKGALVFPFPGRLFFPFAGMGPSLDSRRKSCIRELAVYTHDTTVCELLMPSEYGLACISDLWSIVLPDDGCGWKVSNPTIYQCRHRDGPLRESENCSAFADNEKQFSACIFYFADRNKNFEQCKDVPDALIRSYCETRIDAWNKYPELRNSFYFGKQRY